MSSFAAARSVLRSATAAGRTSMGSRLAAGAKSKPSSSPFSIPKQKQSCPSGRTFRSTVETSRCLDSMLPYHTATASALLTSMISVSRRTCGWTLEVS
ncbi:protein NUCLEAR FUSION DEFECTIVE 6, mitochondrial-like isoform X2 [Humulus lupulus]|uniref:protein NUCLEAR FUSION DEFECTIVE 6, mitochondrial-like isoform X2 n=1 Tax=Humulus lupulus TaxID=3486 RepID=UPI002B4089C1|nr:protein NUCLEAR FUSION DEFECTIVE 6, mitochondrial-like isoform X2 [Humulus lupulus]